MKVFIIATMFIASGFIHRLRGGLLYDLGIKIPGREFLWTAPLLGVLAYLATRSWELSLAYVLSMVIWSLIPHSRWWFCGGRSRDIARPQRPPNMFELLCEKIMDKITGNTNVSDFALFSLKHYVSAIPFFFVLPISAIVYIPICIMVSMIYRTVLKYAEDKFWLTETLSGAIMWGTPVLLFFLR